MKKCPFCAEEIQDEAIKCRYCGEFIEQSQTSKQSNKASEVTKEKKENKFSWGWLAAPFWLIILGGIFAYYVYDSKYKNVVKTLEEINTTKDKYCLNSEGLAYEISIYRFCATQDLYDLTNVKISKQDYLDIMNGKDWESVFRYSGGKLKKKKILDITKSSSSKYCLYSNGSKFSNVNDCKINNETIVGITMKEFLDLYGDKVDWVDVFIRNGGDPSKIYINDKETEKQIIDESQNKILEELQKNRGATDDLKNTIKGTRDIKILACILGGNFNLLNILEFIEDCY